MAKMWTDCQTLPTLSRMLIM